MPKQEFPEFIASTMPQPQQWRGKIIWRPDLGVHQASDGLTWSTVGAVSGAGKANKVALFGNSTLAGGAGIDNISGGSSWSPSTAYTTTTPIYPQYWDLRNGVAAIKWVCSTAGTSGALEPDWPHNAAVGTTVTDGSVVWTATAIGGAANLRWAWGWWHIGQALSGQRLDEAIICGRSGKQSDDILQYVPRAIAAADIGVVAFIGMFENDCWPGAAPVLATIYARWAAFVVQADACLAAGKKLILATLFPSGNIDSSSSFTGYSFGTGSRAWLWLNTQIREYAKSRSGVILWDVAAIYTDTNPANPVYPENTTTYLSATGSGQQLKKTDGIHHLNATHWSLGVSLGPLISANFLPRPVFTYALDPNNTTVNPLMHGTSGTNGTNSSGSVANSFTVNAYGTGTGTASKVARTDIAGNWQRVAYSMTTGDNCQVTWASNQTPPFAVGEVVQGFGEIQMGANPTLMTFPYFRIRFVSATEQFVDAALVGDTTKQDFGQFITSTTMLTLKTPPVVVPTGMATVNTFTGFYGRGACSCTLDIGRVAIMRKTQPATA